MVPYFGRKGLMRCRKVGCEVERSGSEVEGERRQVKVEREGRQVKSLVDMFLGSSNDISPRCSGDEDGYVETSTT